MFHGEIPQATRNRALDERFRYGSAPVLLASVGSCQAGLDLYCANRAVFMERAWSDRIEAQAMARLLRPQQTKPVTVERFHIRGSLDEYQAQHCRFKKASAAAGLDWCQQETEGEEFVHMDQIIDGFVEGLAALRGMRGFELRESLKEAA
jgi:superfamily II DNA or RNA helicase